jgi:hypothetical protein
MEHVALFLDYYREAGSVLIWVPVPWYGALIYGKLGHYREAYPLDNTLSPG